MSSKGSWDIIGWGVIIYAVICALPYILVCGIVLWLVGYFAILFKLLLAGFAVYIWIILSAVIEQRKIDRL